MVLAAGLEKVKRNIATGKNWMMGLGWWERIDAKNHYHLCVLPVSSGAVMSISCGRGDQGA